MKTRLRIWVRAWHEQWGGDFGARCCLQAGLATQGSLGTERSGHAATRTASRLPVAYVAFSPEGLMGASVIFTWGQERGCTG